MGRLRCYASHLAAAAIIVQIWAAFLSTYPDVHLELAVGEAPIDIVARQFDAGIGPHDRVPADMVAVRVTAPMKVVVVGAAELLCTPAAAAHAGRPRTPQLRGISRRGRRGRVHLAVRAQSAKRGASRWRAG